MKTLFKFIIILIFLHFYKNPFAQNDYLWPIKGEIVEFNIISKPQSFIEVEQNPDQLIIGAKANSLVVCPKEGKIKHIGYNYLIALSYSISITIEYPKDTFSLEVYDEKYRINIAKDMSKKYNNISIDPRYISMQLGIITNNNEIYYISGLRPVKYFKTGEILKKGEIIGKVGFCYNRIKNPSIMFSRSINSKPADPMSVFGLKSTFISSTAPQKDYLKYKHSIEQLKEAFTIFKNSLEEGHPGIYDYTTKSSMDSLFATIELSINKPMTSEEFRNLILPIIAAIKDSHTSLYSTIYNTFDGSISPIILGCFENKLIIFSATNEYKKYINSEVVKINGENANTVISKVKNTIIGSDGYIESHRECAIMYFFMRYYRLLYQTYDGFNFNLTLANGEQLNLKYSKKNKPTPLINYRPTIKSGFATKEIDKKTAYLGISSFDLLQTEEDEIKRYVKKISDSSYKNLIIDLRFNAGGSVEVMRNLFALFANKPFQVCSYSKVNKNNTYEFFKYTSNYVGVTGIFDDYIYDSEKKEYIKNAQNTPLEFGMVEPNDSIHFTGNIFVLTNEYSLSASAVFAGLMNKHNRGLIIGRETSSAYYHLNAFKFAQVILGSTALEVYLPLVKEVFTDEINEKIPWGRGVIPDYEVKPTNEEYINNEDKILNYTISLINKSPNNTNIVD